MKATFKVHKVHHLGLLAGKHTVERVVLHPIDPHEAKASRPHDLFKTSRSGENGQIKLQIDEPAALGKFQEGAFVVVSFDILPKG